MKNKDNKQNKEILLRKSFVFALDIINFVEKPESSNRDNSIAKKILKSGTAFGENIYKASYANNNSDYIKNLKKSVENAQKTEYWLQLCKYSQLDSKQNNLISDLNELTVLISDKINDVENKD